MKKGTLLVIRKPYQGDAVIQNTFNYAIGSLFEDEDDILTSYIDNEEDSDQIIEEYYRLQAPYNMTDHRRMFHFILTTRTSKSMCTILEEGAYALQNYFSPIGYQAVMVLHSGSYNDALNYHYHILLNPISVTGCRIQDKYQTYQDIVNYLNQYTHALWDWKYRSNH